MGNRAKIILRKTLII